MKTARKKSEKKKKEQQGKSEFRRKMNVRRKTKNGRGQKQKQKKKHFRPMLKTNYLGQRSQRMIISLDKGHTVHVF